tara:strand:- start:12836 stop:13420 length:585 start_codon:yes stop_codon:yes gene_type:complete
MKIFFFLLLIIINVQSWTKADDIRDFEIEGISIGDSLLDFFSEKKIKNFFNYDDLPSDMKFRIAEFYPDDMKMNIYDAIQVFYKPNDKKYILHTISGVVDCSENTKTACKKIYNEIKKNLSSIFNSNPKENKSKHFDDKSGKSDVYRYTFDLDKGKISISYTDWSKKMDFKDNIMVSVNSNESVIWLQNNYGAN